MMNVKQLAELWGVSERRVRLLCERGDIPGAVREGKSWLVPNDTEKPPDRRRRKEESALDYLDLVIDRQPKDNDLLKAVRALASVYTDVVLVDLNLGSFRKLKSRYLTTEQDELAFGYDELLAGWFSSILSPYQNSGLGGILALEGLRRTSVSSTEPVSFPIYLLGNDDPLLITVSFFSDRAVLALCSPPPLPRSDIEPLPKPEPIVRTPSVGADFVNSADGRAELLCDYLSSAPDVSVLALARSGCFVCPVWRLGGAAPTSSEELLGALSRLTPHTAQGVSLSRFFDADFLQECFASDRRTLSAVLPLCTDRGELSVRAEVTLTDDLIRFTLTPLASLPLDTDWQRLSSGLLSDGFDMLWMLDRTLDEVRVLKSELGIPLGYRGALSRPLCRILDLLDAEDSVRLAEWMRTSLDRPVTVAFKDNRYGKALTVIRYERDGLCALCFKIMK